ncbi:MAG TPA: 1-acyl-sn-glycerol-3-phosphate acyltransferase [Bryobacteraceae bacterium]|nr:1-acyl-sn-glycerol-3-phosphate acyltransferase [Bryobacteraceae bacterium]
MKIAVCGFDGPVARAVKAELARRGHTAVDSGVDPHAEAAIWFPGELSELEKIASRTDLRRLVIRSHAYSYGSNPKNPGVMEESRISLLPPNDKAQRWLQAEEAAARHPNWAALRLTNVLAAEEGDLIVGKMLSGSATAVAGRDPNLQFISVNDAANAFVDAVEADATGIFNIAGEGTIPLKKALRAAGTSRIGVPPSGALAELVFNWTLSGDRAARELGFRPSQSTVEALRAFLTAKPGAHPERLARSYDDWGLDVDYIRAWGGWFAFLRNIYWRIESEGMENIPATGKGLFVSNHRGFMPLDAVMHLSLLFTHTKRVPRFLIIHSLLRTPFLANFLTKLGGVVASQENATRLFDQGELVGLFPEGIRGTFSPYKTTYRLRNFSKSGFARMAVENQAPVIPAAVIGHAEIFPILGRIDSSWVVKELGWPYLPIAPMFPLAPIPIPSKWHVRVLAPVPLQGLKPEDAENDRLMKSFSEYVQHIVQSNIDDMLPRRKSIFWGKKVLNGVAPPVPLFGKARKAEA